MKVAVYWGCMILTSQYAYEASVRETLPRLGVELQDIEGVSCCGAPVKSIQGEAALYLAARNLALAEKAGVEDLLVPCNGCHLTFTEAMEDMRNSDAVRSKIFKWLEEEGLKLSNYPTIWHIVDLLHDKIGMRRIAEVATQPLAGMRFVTHPGCHIIRPSNIPRVDDSENPRKLDELVEALGGTSMEYAGKLDCCGAGLIFAHPETSAAMAGLKLKSIQDIGVDGLVVSCPSCQQVYDAKQAVCASTIRSELNVPVLYYTQLLGLAMGLEEKKLGLHLNQSNIEKIVERLGRQFG